MALPRRRVPARRSLGRLVGLLAVASLVAACTGQDEPAPAPEPTASAEAETETETGVDVDDGPVDEPRDDDLADPPDRECRTGDPAAERTVLADVRPQALAVEVAALTHTCADTIVLTPPDAGAAAIAAIVAIASDAPLLVLDPADTTTTATTVERFEPREVVGVGLDPESVATGPAGPDTTRIDGGDLALLAVAAADHLDVSRFVVVDVDDAHARTVTLAGADGQAMLLPLAADDALDALAAQLPANARLQVVASDDAVRARLVDRLLAVGLDAEQGARPDWPARRDSTVWLVDPDADAATAVVAVAARGRDEVLLPVDGADLRAGRDGVRRLRDAAPRQVVLATDRDEADVELELQTLVSAPELPGGGLLLFEDRRMVALYGHPGSRVLGALGEQDLDATVERLRQVAAPYDADGLEVLPAFEIITTIASAEAGPRGDYSRHTPIDTLRPWVERAAEEGIYVFLDLQPGRTDFLTQAKIYEELLREPHVGLALDPEWRLGPDQVHLRQIGSVSAAEVQEVADWLAALTREANLPEKLLVLHQFRFSMLPDRDTIEAPPELAVVIHMDGQGPIGTKYETYAAITAGVEDRWLWGWKNFYDEDSPTPTPEQVLDLDPLPVLVTYQ